MKRRLRKKRNAGEFAIMGVSLRFKLSADSSGDALNQCIDEFIDGPIESQSLQFGGGGADEWSGVVEPGDPARSIPDAALDELQRWLSERPEVVSFEVSEAWDLNHGVNPFE